MYWFLPPIDRGVSCSGEGYDTDVTDVWVVCCVVTYRQVYFYKAVVLPCRRRCVFDSIEDLADVIEEHIGDKGKLHSALSTVQLCRHHMV